MIPRPYPPSVRFVPNDLCPLRQDGGVQGDTACREVRWALAGQAEGEGEPPAAAPYDIRWCATCELAFTDPIPDESSVPALYDDRTSRDFQSEESPRTIAMRRWFAKRDLARQLRALDARPRRALDFATGQGTWALALRDALGPEADVVATDFHDVAPPQLAAEPDLVRYVPYAQVLSGELHGSVDLILARHVLEHTHRPVEVIASFVRMLRPGGLLVCEVPSYETPLRRLFGRHWEFYYAPFHTVHFTAGALEEALRQGGLGEVAVTPSEMPLMGRSIRRLLRRPYGPLLFLLGVVLHPLQLTVGRVTGTAVCLRGVGRKPPG